MKRRQIKADLAAVEKALDIGAVSYAGDDWYAQDAGYGYDEAEAAMEAGGAAFRRIREHLSPLGHGTPVPEEATLPSGDARVAGL